MGKVFPFDPHLVGEFAWCSEMADSSTADGNAVKSEFVDQKARGRVLGYNNRVFTTCSFRVFLSRISADPAPIAMQQVSFSLFH